jgi:small subunit ribosomal protein S21
VIQPSSVTSLQHITYNTRQFKAIGDLCLMVPQTIFTNDFEYFLTTEEGDFVNGIVVREDEAFEKALRRFTKTCERAGILSDVKKYRHYEKPSEEKKRRLNSSKRKRIREEKRATYKFER